MTDKCRQTAFLVHRVLFSRSLTEAWPKQTIFKSKTDNEIFKKHMKCKNKNTEATFNT